MAYAYDYVSVVDRVHCQEDFAEVKVSVVFFEPRPTKIALKFQVWCDLKYILFV